MARRTAGRGSSSSRSAWTPSTSGPTAMPQSRHDVVSVGADPRRDFELLLELARRLPDRSFRIVASADNAAGARALSRERPSSRSTSRSHASASASLGARVVALPVRENTYSGATTTLLQAMACGKPVVVTRTAAIARGYHLEDGVNCRLVAAGRPRRRSSRRVTGVLDDGDVRGRARAERAGDGRAPSHMAALRGRDPRRLLADAAERHDGRA